MNLLETRGPHPFGPWHVTQIVEWEGEAMPHSQLFPGVPLETVRQASPAGSGGRVTAGGKIVMSTQIFLLEREGLAVLIEMGTGNRKSRPDESDWHNQNLPYGETLRSLGVEPGQIDYVFFTHLHVDHVGWATTQKDGAWVPTFPRARYVINRAEWDFWNACAPGTPARHPCLDDSVRPLVEAGVVEWTAPGALVSGLRVHEAAGHTPGHVLLELEGEAAWFIGDLFHHPAQISRPDWPSDSYDTDQELNTRCRTRWLKRFAESGAVLFGVHVGNPFQVAATAAGGFFPKKI